MAGDGILGLSPLRNWESEDEHVIESDFHQPNLLERFYDGHLIDNNVFALHLSDDTEDRRLVIGGYDH